MTLVFRNRLDPDNRRQIFLPSAPDAPATDVTTVAQLKAAMLTPGNYNVAAGLYVADHVIDNVAGIHLHCAPGVIFRATSASAEVFTLRTVTDFSITGTWQVDCGAQLGMEIGDLFATTQAAQPDNVLLDGGTFLPFYISGPGSASRAVAVHGSNVTISNCRMEGFYRNGQEVQALWIHNTNGPVTVTDCFLEGAGENVMIGGEDVLIPNAIPSDIVFKRCTFYKRPSWRPPSAVTVKNNFEVKNGQRILLQDNVHDGAWKGSQTGNGIVLTVRNSNHVISPWVIVDDVTVDHSIIRNIYEPGSFVVSILGHEDHVTSPSQQTRTIRLTNNVFEDGTGGVQVSLGVTDLLLIDHNTFAGDTTAELLQFANLTTKTTLTMTNNVGNQGAYGVYAAGITLGNVTNALNGACNVGWSCVGNVWGRNKSQSVTWPGGNTVVGPASTPLVLTPPPGCQLTGAQAGMNAGWNGNATGVGVNLDGTTP